MYYGHGYVLNLQTFLQIFNFIVSKKEKTVSQVMTMVAQLFTVFGAAILYMQRNNSCIVIAMFVYMFINIIITQFKNSAVGYRQYANNEHRLK